MEDKISRVTIHGFMAKYYDTILNLITFGKYPGLLNKAIEIMNLKSDEKILDIGAGSGRNACLMHNYLNDNGEILGFDIEPVMIHQFKKKCVFDNTKIEKHDIIEPFPYVDYFDRVFISFVIHGFSRENRKIILKNINKSLKKGGKISIFDYGNFKFESQPFFIKTIFKIAECPYAFEYISDDREKMLTDIGFNNVKINELAGKYVTLTTAIKNS
ncbi:hypothetical protein DRP44_07285 [candidate division TA06 bacterium]|uniref:Methyltransferase domain-containing protein n=1 Tax=candidate division TA06 bacterium TaxID=2250710 RepID=A0A660S5P8_UNCT6|nr:MAG: hypothetical protein DRP44_07285 [candidate division TA06 bacterium]